MSPAVRRFRAGQQVKAPVRRRTAAVTLERRRRSNVVRNLAEHETREARALVYLIREARRRGLAVFIETQRVQDLDWAVREELGV